MSKWICTDSDSAQYHLQIDDLKWAYVEVREIHNGWAVCHAVVDLRDFTLDELWDYCSTYYNSYEQMVSCYGFREALQIMAECVFEQLSFDEMEFNIEKKTLAEAEKFIRYWMNGYEL